MEGKKSWKFKELTIDEFRKFSSRHPLRNYLQTPEIAQFRESEGWTGHFVGVVEGRKILCATMMTSRPTKFGKYFSSPRGYLIDFRDYKLLSFFTSELKKYAMRCGGYVVNIEPKVWYKERDINGDLVEGGFDNRDIYENLIKLGYRHGGFYKQLDLGKQVRWAFALPLGKKTEKEVFSGFKPNTRNIINKLHKDGARVREMKYSELDKFKQLVDSSGDRKHFIGRSLAYYQKMYKLFKDSGTLKFLVAELNLTKYSSKLTGQIKAYEARLDKNELKSAGEERELRSQLELLQKRLKNVDRDRKKHGDTLLMSGGMFMFYGTETVYLYSGSAAEHLSYGAQYLVQWEVIKRALAGDYKFHNFYGISGNFSENDPRWGVYKFKKSFGGQVVEYIGDFDLVVKPFNYNLAQIVKAIKNKLRR